MAKQIPDLTQLLPADLTADDLLVIRDISAQKDKKIRVGDLTGMPSIGWISALETWTFASFANGIGVVNIPSGGLTKYAVGMKVQFSQATGGKKYAIITGVTNTTLTLAMMLSASLTNESVATPQYSTEAAPPTSDNVDWATSGSYAFSVYETAGQTAGNTTLIQFGGTRLNKSGAYTNANGRYTAKVTGMYHFDAQLQFNALSTQVVWVGFNVNGVAVGRLSRYESVSANYASAAGIDYPLNAGDYVTITSQVIGTARTLEAGYSYFSGHLVSVG